MEEIFLLHDVAKYYRRDNPDHNAALDLLDAKLPEISDARNVLVEATQLWRKSSPPPMREGVKLDNVRYLTQRDNPRLAASTCNVTSMAMVFYAYGLTPRQTGQQFEDELLQWCLDNHGPDSQVVHWVLERMVNEYGLRGTFTTTRTWEQIKAELKAQRPVVIAGWFTASGHIITLIGFNDEGFWVHDPWGNALTQYKDVNGESLLYPYDYMNRVCGQDGSLWAHFIQRPTSETHSTWTPNRELSSPPPRLTRQDYQEVAPKIGLWPATLRAFAEVESAGSGYLEDHRLKILFEGHIFWHQLKQAGKDPLQYQTSDPTIVYPQWTRKYYLGGSREYERLNAAKKIDETSALMATSWGLFQLMGFNHSVVGYATPQVMIEDFKKGERPQLEAIVRFMRSQNIHLDLQRGGWSEAVRKYNGPGAVTEYSGKLKAAFNRWYGQWGKS